MSSDRNEMVRFALDHIDSEPLARRVKIYRALADVCGDEQEAANMKALADDLERTDHLCREFAFRFQNPQRRKGK